MCEMELWNEKNLPVPPINTYKASNTNIDIKHLYNVFREGKEFFDNEKYMHAEYLVLSRIVYRMKQKFRSAKDFKALEKLDKALDNYFKMDISLNLKQFMDLIPSRYKEETYLPTKNLLDYILVRLQGLIKLMERVVETSKIVAYLSDKRMHTGHFWKIAFIIFSLVSRVFTLARYIAKFVCDFYRKLRPFSSQLRNTSKGWLPENYVLPKDLTEWMNVDWLEFDDEIQIIEVPTEIPDIMKFFDLVDDDDDVQFCDEYFMIDDDEDDDVLRDSKKGKNKVQNTFLERLGELRGFDNQEDIGEVIKIEDSFCDFSNDGDKIVSEPDVLESVQRSDGSNDKEVSGIDHNMFLLDKKIQDLQNSALNESIKMDQPGDCLKVKENLVLHDVSVADSAANEGLQNNNKVNNLKSSDSTSNLKDNIMYGFIDSEDDNLGTEKDEENIVTIFDLSVSEKPADNPRPFSNQEKNVIEVESDEDVITISDTSILETDVLKPPEKRRLKRQKTGSKTKLKRSNTNSKRNKDKIIIIPDTPKYTDSDVYSNDLEDSIFMLENSIKSLRDIHRKVKKDKTVKAIKGAKQLNQHKVSLGKLKRATELEDLTSVISARKKNKKAPKQKNGSEVNDGLKNKLHLENNSILNRTKEKMLKKRDKSSNKLKASPKKLKLAIESLAESSNIVRKRRENIPSAMSSIAKIEKRKGRKTENSSNSNLVNISKRKKKANIKNGKKGENSSILSAKLKNETLNAQNGTTPHSTQINIVSKISKKKKWKQSALSSLQNIQIGLSQNGINIHKSPNVSANFKKKKLATNKNAKVNKKQSNETEYLTKVLYNKLPYQINLSTAGPSSNNLGKRKRYEEKQTKNHMHLKKKKQQNQGSAEGSKLLHAQGDSSRPVKSGKRNKKNKMVNKINLGQSLPQKTSGKITHKQNNVAKVVSDSKNMRKKKKKFGGSS